MEKFKIKNTGYRTYKVYNSDSKTLIADEKLDTQFVNKDIFTSLIKLHQVNLNDKIFTKSDKGKSLIIGSIKDIDNLKPKVFKFNESFLVTLGIIKKTYKNDKLVFVISNYAFNKYKQKSYKFLKNEKIVKRFENSYNNNHKETKNKFKDVETVIDGTMYKIFTDNLKLNAKDIMTDEFCWINDEIGPLLESIKSKLNKTNILNYELPIWNDNCTQEELNKFHTHSILKRILNEERNKLIKKIKNIYYSYADNIDDKTLKVKKRLHTYYLFNNFDKYFSLNDGILFANKKNFNIVYYEQKTNSKELEYYHAQNDMAQAIVGSINLVNQDKKNFLDVEISNNLEIQNVIKSTFEIVQSIFNIEGNVFKGISHINNEPKFNNYWELITNSKTYYKILCKCFDLKNKLNINLKIKNNKFTDITIDNNNLKNINLTESFEKKFEEYGDEIDNIINELKQLKLQVKKLEFWENEINEVNYIEKIKTVFDINDIKFNDNKLTLEIEKLSNNYEKIKEYKVNSYKDLISYCYYIYDNQWTQNKDDVTGSENISFDNFVNGELWFSTSYLTNKILHKDDNGLDLVILKINLMN